MFNINGDSYKVNDGKVFTTSGDVGILLSDNEHGWSTSNPNKKIMYFPNLIKYILKGGDLSDIDKNIMEELYELNEGINNTCTLGMKDLRIKWIKPNSVFKVIMCHLRQSCFFFIFYN